MKKKCPKCKGKGCSHCGGTGYHNDMNKGGKPGQWSARKAQMLAKQNKAKGGGYR